MPSIKQLRRKNSKVTAKNSHNEDIHCFDCAPDKNNRDFFCTSMTCPLDHRQPAFPSPNSTFSLNELAEITECIEQANELLLSLALERDEENLRTIQLSLKKLVNQHVSVTINCQEEQQGLEGYLVDVGLNFVLLESSVGNIFAIPFERIILIKDINIEEKNSEQKPKLIDIHPCLRRSLTFNFAQVVSKSPFLINLFFGLKLELFLESYVGCFVYVRADKSKDELDGVLRNVNNRRIEITMDNEKQGIDFDEMCWIEIEQEALTNKYLNCNEHQIST